MSQRSSVFQTARLAPIFLGRSDPVSASESALLPPGRLIRDGLRKVQLKDMQVRVLRYLDITPPGCYKEAFAPFHPCKYFLMLTQFMSKNILF